jgi:hypothetical protein
MLNSLEKIKILIFITIATICLGCDAAAPRSAVDICYLLKHTDQFREKIFELHSDVMFTMHGRHLYGSKCSDLGSLALSIDEKRYDEKEIKQFIDQVMAQRGRARVALIGRFVQTPFKNYVGIFVLADVIDVTIEL